MSVLNRYRPDVTVTLIGFSIFAPMSAKGIIYILSFDLFSSYHFHFNYNQSYNLIKTDAIVFLNILFSSSQEFSLRVLLSFYLIICQFQPRVACKIVAYKKSMHLIKTSFSKYFL